MKIHWKELQEMIYFLEKVHFDWALPTVEIAT